MRQIYQDFIFIFIFEQLIELKNKSQIKMYSESNDQNQQTSRNFSPLDQDSKWKTTTLQARFKLVYWLDCEQRVTDGE